MKKEKLAKGWKYIETAPKDSSFILVSAGNQCSNNPGATGVVVARWNGQFWNPMFAEGEYCGAKYWHKLPELID